MNNHFKLAVLGLFFVPLVGLFAFSAFSASAFQNPAFEAAVADAGEAASTAATVPSARAPSWAEASPEALAGIESLDAKLQEEATGFDSLQNVKAQGIAHTVGFEGQPPARALETVLVAMARMADAYEAMGQEARRALEAKGALARVDALMTCNLEEARKDAAASNLAAQYQISVEKRERREAEQFQDNLTMKLLARKGWFDGFPYWGARSGSMESTDGFDGLLPAKEAKTEPRSK